MLGLLLRHGVEFVPVVPVTAFITLAAAWEKAATIADDKSEGVFILTTDCRFDNLLEPPKFENLWYFSSLNYANKQGCTFFKGKWNIFCFER